MRVVLFRFSDDDAVETCRASSSSSQTDLATCSDVIADVIGRRAQSCSRLSDDDGYDVIVDDSDDDSADVFHDSFAKREVNNAIYNVVWLYRPVYTR